MRKNAAVTPMEIVTTRLTWTSDDNGIVGNEVITAAALLDVARTLRAINDKLDALGADGIHQLIRAALTETRAKRRARLNRKKVKS